MVILNDCLNVFRLSNNDSHIYIYSYVTEGKCTKLESISLSDYFLSNKIDKIDNINIFLLSALRKYKKQTKEYPYDFVYENNFFHFLTKIKEMPNKNNITIHSIDKDFINIVNPYIDRCINLFNESYSQDNVIIQLRLMLMNYTHIYNHIYAGNKDINIDKGFVDVNTKNKSPNFSGEFNDNFKSFLKIITNIKKENKNNMLYEITNNLLLKIINSIMLCIYTCIFFKKIYTYFKGIQFQSKIKNVYYNDIIPKKVFLLYEMLYTYFIDIIDNINAIFVKNVLLISNIEKILTSDINIAYLYSYESIYFLYILNNFYNYKVTHLSSGNIDTVNNSIKNYKYIEYTHTLNTKYIIDEELEINIFDYIYEENNCYVFDKIYKELKEIKKELEHIIGNIHDENINTISKEVLPNKYTGCSDISLFPKFFE